MTGYVLVCGCTGQAIAYLDDDRAAGGRLTVRSVRGSQQTVIAARPTIEGMPPIELLPHEVIAKEWAEHDVSETLWDDGHFNWAIHCKHCGKNPQMSDATFATVADELAEALDTLAAVPDVDGTTRYLIPFGVLCSRLARFIE